jgi:hypothetical protein
MEAIFAEYEWTSAQRERLDRDGHLVLPGLLTAPARERLTEALARIDTGLTAEPQPPNHYAAEHEAYLASLIAHPQLLMLARRVLGPEVRYDHCVSLNRPGGNRGSHWHSHEYGEERPELGFIRIFFYVNGFAPDDGGLGVVPGSHLYRDAKIHALSDEALREGWLAGKRHLLTGEPLSIEYLAAPSGSVVLMWTHAAHAVSPRQPESATRWTVVYAYRNPGLPSRARWITPAFEASPPPGAEGLMSLY